MQIEMRDVSVQAIWAGLFYDSAATHYQSRFSMVLGTDYTADRKWKKVTENRVTGRGKSRVRG